MNTHAITKIEEKYMQKKVTPFRVGDTVEVSNIIREGEKQRTQKFKGLVISIKGAGTRKMFKVRKISYGIGVEKTFPLYSPNVASVSLLKSGKVRRAKLFFMRDRVGRLALKVKPGQPMVVVEHADEAQPETLAPEDIAPIQASEPVAEVEAVEAAA